MMIDRQRIHVSLSGTAVGTARHDPAIDVELDREQKPQQLFIDPGKARRGKKRDALLRRMPTERVRSS